MVLVLDNFDSFTYNLVDYLSQLNQESVVLRNDVRMEEIKKYNFDSILLSPGPCTPSQAGIMNELIATYYKEKPILGICLGHQALGEFFGWTLEKAIRPMHGKMSDVQYQEHDLFNQISNPFSAMRYHSLVLSSTAKDSDLEMIAWTKEMEVMALAHKQLPIAGFQFHPESVLTADGLTLLRNWFRWIAQ